MFSSASCTASVTLLMSIRQPVSLAAKTSILPFAPNRQRKLIIRHDHDRRPSGVGIVFEIDAAHARRTERFGDEDFLIGIPLDNVDFLFVEFLDDILNANAAHPDARANRIDAFLKRGDRDFRAIARFTSDILDLDLSVVDFRDFVFQQAAQHIAVGCG